MTWPLRGSKETRPSMKLFFSSAKRGSTPSPGELDPNPSADHDASIEQECSSCVLRVGVVLTLPERLAAAGHR